MVVWTTAPQAATSFFSIGNALRISKEADIYAYDAYVLDCAARYKAPLLTLDRKLMSAAFNLGIETLEV